MNQKDLDDLRDFIYLLVKKSNDYIISPKKSNLKFLRFISNNFFMCLPKKAKDFFRDDFITIKENIGKGFDKLKQFEIKKENNTIYYSEITGKDLRELESELNDLKEGL